MQKVQSRLTIIFAAFLSSSLFYLIVGFALQKTGWKPVIDSGSLGTLLFGIFVMVAIGLIGVLMKIKGRFSEETEQRAFSKSIILFAIAEVPSILGLVLFLLTGRFLYLAILCALSITAFLVVRPK